MFKNTGCQGKSGFQIYTWSTSSQGNEFFGKKKFKYETTKNLHISYHTSGLKDFAQADFFLIFVFVITFLRVTFGNEGF